MKQTEDHMDELFRKAGENYPLNTDGADWDRVLNGLQQADHGRPVPPLGSGKNKNYRKLWWLALLLPLALVCNNYGGRFYNRWRGHGPASSTVAASAPSTAATYATAPSARAPLTVRPSSVVPKTVYPTTTNSSATGSSEGAAYSGHTVHMHANKLSGSPAFIAPAGTVTTAGNSSTGLSGTANAGDKVSDNAVSNTASSGTAISSTGSSNTGSPGTAAADTGTSATGLPSTVSASLKTPDTTTVAKNTTTNKLADTTTGKKRPSIAKATTHGLYGGFLLGPDISTIKGQKIQDPGYSVGITVGFRFNKRFAVETGALWDHKSYYTSGEYFDAKRTSLPPGADIKSLNGYCNMIELPISFRWDFLQLRHGGLYATGGFSSYLMKKEYYNYDASYGTGASWWGSNSYINSGNNFFSIARVSAGYTFKWDHIGDVRIEPYWSIPITGVGIGRMDIMSTGLYLGITHPFR